MLASVVFGETQSVRGMTILLAFSVHVFEFACTQSVRVLRYSTDKYIKGRAEQVRQRKKRSGRKALRLGIARLGQNILKGMTHHRNL